MSYNTVDAFVRAASSDPRRFSNAEFRLLVTLFRHRNRQTGRCDPGSGRLAQETGFSKSYVVKMLHDLETRGEIVADDPSSKGGRGHRQQYTLTLRNGHSGVTL